MNFDSILSITRPNNRKKNRYRTVKNSLGLLQDTKKRNKIMCKCIKRCLAYNKGKQDTVFHLVS